MKTNILNTLATSALIGLIVFFHIPPTHADDSIRDSATRSLNLLQQSGLDKLAPEEHASIMFVFSAAERYWKAGNHTLSDRYFRLSTQKADILIATLSPKADPVTPDEAPELRVSPSVVKYETPSASWEPEANTGEAQGSSISVEPNKPAPLISTKLIGTESYYIVRKADTLKLVAARLGVNRQHLITLNKLTSQTPLRTGQKLRYNNRKIVPLQLQEGILINIPDRTLYLFKNGELSATAPVALGAPRKDGKYDWTTPIGKFKIVAKQKDPIWFVPRSIQAEMEEMGKEVVTTVPPGPQNPLGKYALKTSFPGILIHSTTKPTSIYSFSSHGCIRIHPEHMEKFFNEIKRETPGEIVYQPVKIAVLENGRVFLEVHRDAYGRRGRADEDARHLIEQNNLSDRVDWKKVRSVVRQQAGLAEDITF